MQLSAERNADACVFLKCTSIMLLHYFGFNDSLRCRAQDRQRCCACVAEAVMILHHHVRAFVVELFIAVIVMVYQMSSPMLEVA